MSSINPNNINGQYPVAGQDNDSQGFRDNFTNIINNFTFAYNELNDLQQNALLKNPLNGTTLSNDMNYAQLVKPQLLNVVETQNPIVGAVSGSKSISWLDGDFQKFTTGGDVVLGITNWPQNGTRAKLRLQITTGSNVANITFPTIMSNVGIASIQGFVSGQQIRLDGSNVYQFELSSSDNGGTLHIQDVLRNYNVETTGVSGTFTTINAGTVSTSGNVLAGKLTVFGNTSIGLVGTVGGQSHSIIGNITQTSSGGDVYINTTGNVLAAGGIYNALTVNGSTTVNGNLNSAGTHVETGYQQIKPTANVANVSISPTVTRVLIHPTSVLTAIGGSFGANLTLPNTQVDGTIISISSNVTMASLSVITPWVGTSVSPAGNAASVAPGTVSRFMFINADKVWYKIA
jgi:hypothetical protein